MRKGWNRQRLLVDLTTGEIKSEILEQELLTNFLGGRGLNIQVLNEMTDQHTDPLGPENPLILGVGPLTGTMVPGNGRFNISAKSPLTGILGDSNSGGFFAPELKYAGYDQVIITGQAEEPVYLSILDDQIEIHRAQHIWGKNTWETDEILKKELADERIQVAVIGQAGENLVKIAAIMNNLGRAAGRTGMGAVMGSKRLKAIVVRGTKGIGINDPDRFQKHLQLMMQTVYTAPSYQTRSTYGTTMLLSLYNEKGVLPFRNCQSSYYQDADMISGETLLKKYVTNLKACFSCPVHCSRYYRVEEGLYAGARGEGPEFETMSTFGSRCDNNNLESILQANTLCNQYGLDTISTGNVIAFAMECYENGLLTEGDTGGLDLSWGRDDTIIELVHQIARREGLGNLLASGIKRASEAIPGSERYALHVKGLETPAQGIRGLKAWGLGWAVASRGADHLRAFPLAETTWKPEEAEEFFGTREIVNRFAYEGKAKLIKWSEEFSAVTDCLETCKILAMGLTLPIEEMAVLLSAVTGSAFTGDGLLKIGERLINLERFYNSKLGLDRKDDRLPDRFREEQVPEGNSRGEVIDEDQMLNDYYLLRGWDGNGLPTTAKLVELGLVEQAN